MMATFSAGSDASDILFEAPAVLVPSQHPHPSAPHPHSHPLASFWLFTKPIAAELFIMSVDDDEGNGATSSGEERILENISHLLLHNYTHSHRYSHNTHTHKTHTQSESRER